MCVVTVCALAAYLLIIVLFRKSSSSSSLLSIPKEALDDGGELLVPRCKCAGGDRNFYYELPLLLQVCGKLDHGPKRKKLPLVEG